MLISNAYKITNKSEKVILNNNEQKPEVVCINSIVNCDEKALFKLVAYRKFIVPKGF